MVEDLEDHRSRPWRQDLAPDLGQCDGEPDLVLAVAPERRADFAAALSQLEHARLGQPAQGQEFGHARRRRAEHEHARVVVARAEIAQHRRRDHDGRVHQQAGVLVEAELVGDAVAAEQDDAVVGQVVPRLAEHPRVDADDARVADHPALLSSVGHIAADVADSGMTDRPVPGDLHHRRGGAAGPAGAAVHGRQEFDGRARRRPQEGAHGGVGGRRGQRPVTEPVGDHRRQHGVVDAHGDRVAADFLPAHRPGQTAGARGRRRRVTQAEARRDHGASPGQRVDVPRRREPADGTEADAQRAGGRVPVGQGHTHVGHARAAVRGDERDPRLVVGPAGAQQQRTTPSVFELVRRDLGDRDPDLAGARLVQAQPPRQIDGGAADGADRTLVLDAEPGDVRGAHHPGVRVTATTSSRLPLCPCRPPCQA